MQLTDRHQWEINPTKLINAKVHQCSKRINNIPNQQFNYSNRIQLKNHIQWKNNPAQTSFNQNSSSLNSANKTNTTSKSYSIHKQRNNTRKQNHQKSSNINEIARVSAFTTIMNDTAVIINSTTEKVRYLDGTRSSAGESSQHRRNKINTKTQQQTTHPHLIFESYRNNIIISYCNAISISGPGGQALIINEKNIRSSKDIRSKVNE